MLLICSASGAVLPATCYAKAMESHPTEGLKMSLPASDVAFVQPIGDPTKKMEEILVAVDIVIAGQRGTHRGCPLEDAKSFLLRLRGTSLQQACTDCAEAPVRSGAVSLLRPGST